MNLHKGEERRGEERKKNEKVEGEANGGYLMGLRELLVGGPKFQHRVRNFG